MAMGTLINGSDAGIAIITSAVAAANATLIRAHQAVDQVNAFADQWAQSPVGSIIGAQHTLGITSSFFRALRRKGFGLINQT